MFTGYASYTYVIYWFFDGCIYGDFLVIKRDVYFLLFLLKKHRWWVHVRKRGGSYEYTRSSFLEQK